MKLIPWNIASNIEAYTVTKELGDMSFNNPDKQLILNNRQQLAKLLKTNFDHMVAPRQVHSANFKEVSLKDGGKGIYDHESAFQETDALYTKDSDLFLLSFHADCTPVLLYCQDTEIIAAIHSGWLGTTKQIVSKVTSHLINHEHCDPKQIKAYIGPCICQDCLEVMDNVIDLVKQMDFDTSPFYYQTDELHYQLDNKGLNKQMLLNLGVLEKNITVSPYCTVENDDLFFSYRKNKDNGRNITIIKRKATMTK